MSATKRCLLKESAVLAFALAWCGLCVGIAWCMEESLLSALKFAVGALVIVGLCALGGFLLSEGTKSE